MGTMKQIDIEIKNSLALSYLSHEINLIKHELTKSKSKIRRFLNWIRRL